MVEEDLLGVERLLAVLALPAQASAAVVLFLVDLQAGLTDKALVAPQSRGEQSRAEVGLEEMSK